MAEPLKYAEELFGPPKAIEKKKKKNPELSHGAMASESNLRQSQ